MCTNISNDELSSREVSKVFEEISVLFATVTNVPEFLTERKSLDNRPFYSCVLGDLALIQTSLHLSCKYT